MSQIQISTETALRETMIENEWRKGRMMILAQQLAEAQRRVIDLDAVARPPDPPVI